MNLAQLSFPIDYDSFHAFLVTTVPNADGMVTTDTGITVIEKIAFVQTDIDNINNYYNNLTAAGELAKLTPTPQAALTQKILNRMSFGQQLMASFGAQNTLSGMSTTEVTQVASAFSDIQALLQAGSLETANTLIQSTTPNALVSQDTINAFSAQITAYLAAGG